MQTHTLLGVPVVTGTREQLLDAALALFETGGTVATVNATMLERARRNKAFRNLLGEMSLCIPDGVGVARALSKRGELTDTLPGVELGLLLLMARIHLRVALYGARVGVAEAAAQYICSLCPTAEIVLIRDGYSHTAFEVREALVRCAPDLVFICLGSPKQEEVAHLVARALPRAVVMGLGGSFDVWSGRVHRAPPAIRRVGLEWLYRMVREPRRIARLPSLFSFSFYAFLEQMQAKSPKKPPQNVKTKK